MNVAGYKYFYLSIAAALVVASLACIAVFGFHTSIEFTGGGLWEVHVPSHPAPSDLQKTVEQALGESAQVTTVGDESTYLVRFGSSDASGYETIRTAVMKEYGSFEERSFQSIGPSVSDTLRRNAVLAIVFVLLAISLYIVFAFRTASGPVRPWAYGVTTMISLLHDVAIPAGMLAILGATRGIEIDTNFIVALLVVMGFSVHDTIVVFDRIRENLITAPDKRDFKAIVNASVTQTVARSINTSLTLLIVLVALLIVGPASLWYFVLTLFVGVIAGAYSSIFVASPLLLVVSERVARPTKR